MNSVCHVIQHIRNPRLLSKWQMTFYDAASMIHLTLQRGGGRGHGGCGGGEPADP